MQTSMKSYNSDLAFTTWLVIVYAMLLHRDRYHMHQGEGCFCGDGSFETISSSFLSNKVQCL